MSFLELLEDVLSGTESVAHRRQRRVGSEPGGNNAVPRNIEIVDVKHLTVCIGDKLLLVRPANRMLVSKTVTDIRNTNPARVVPAMWRAEPGALNCGSEPGIYPPTLPETSQRLQGNTFSRLWLRQVKVI